MTRCVSEARAALVDTEQKMIKIVSRRGYVFAGPVTQRDDGPVVKPAVEAPTRNERDLGGWRWKPPLLAMVAILAVAGIAWYGISSQHQATSPPRLSLVVLPFANLNVDPAQEYLGDVITEDLTTALSRLDGHFRRQCAHVEGQERQHQTNR